MWQSVRGTVPPAVLTFLPNLLRVGPVAADLLLTFSADGFGVDVMYVWTQIRTDSTPSPRTVPARICIA